ncbi:MAG TPA: hypothetical protein VFQ42_19170 [Mycobacterium sp.]|nr:hypothetical protein [Mycobacterium sp.]
MSAPRHSKRPHTGHPTVPVRDLIARLRAERERPEFGADNLYAAELAAMRAELVEQEMTDRMMALPAAMLTETVAPVAPPIQAAAGVVSGVLDAVRLSLDTLFARGGVA